MVWRAKQFRLSGGVNEEDPQFVVNEKTPGCPVFSRNYEPRQGGGYTRMLGYERYDSQASPSAATYKWATFSLGVVAPTDNLYVNGATSGAHGYIAGTAQLDSGAWASGTAAGKVAVCAITGTFVSGENLRRNSDNVVLCKLDSAMTAGATTDDSWSTWIAGARNHYRGLILGVPGYGSILGVFILNGYVYAWRATAADHTKQALYKATGGAWVLQTLTGYIRYTNGTAAVNEGDTITGATSGATAVVRRISIGAGTYAGPTYASGRFAITGVTGTFQNGENLQVGGVTKAVANGANVAAAAMTATAARHETKYYNFYGATNLKRIYGCDGVNRAYEFDGTYFCNIETGMTTDTPTHLEIFKNYLWMSFPGGSLQNCGTGTPLVWSPRTGASEIGVGDDVTGIAASGVALAVMAAKTVKIITGSSNSDWAMTSVTDDAGSMAYSAQEVGGQTLFVDRSGINVLLPPPPVGSQYSTQSLSRMIRKTIQASAANTVDSLHLTIKDQYRIYFNDKTGIVGTFSGTNSQGWMQTKYAHQFTCSVEGTDTSGLLRSFAGTDADGYVMELEVGASHDGTAIESLLQLPFGYYGIPDRDKRWHKITLEVDTPRTVALYYGIDFDYGASGQPGRFTASAGNTTDVSSFALFGTLFWETNVLSSPETNIDGIGRSIGIAIYHNDASDASFTVSAMLLQYTPLGIKR